MKKGGIIVKRRILLILAALLVISACSCKPSTTGTNEEAALKVSEFAASLNTIFQEAFDSLSSVKTPVCKAEGHDLIIIYEHDKSVSMTPEEWEELAESDDLIHYPYYKDLVEYVGDEGVRLVIKYVDADGETMATHIIDKGYAPSSTNGIDVIEPNDVDIEALKSKLDKYCADNQDRLTAEYGEIFDGASGPRCYIEDLNLVLEYRYTANITRQEFFEIIEESVIAFNPVAADLIASMGNMPVGIIIRCFDSNGDKLLDYPIGGLSPIVEFQG